MELICLGFLLGTVFSIIMVGTGVLYDKHSERQCGVDSDTRIYIPCRDRDRGGSDRRTMEMDDEEVITTLQTIQLAGSFTEKAAIDYAIEKIRGTE